MTTAPHTRVGGGSARVVGATALALAASLIVQNVVVGAGGAPDYGDPIADVLAFHAEHRGAVAIAVGLEALNLPLLLGFLAGLHGPHDRGCNLVAPGPRRGCDAECDLGNLRRGMDRGRALRG